MDDRTRFDDLVQVWHRCAIDVVALLRDLDPDDWARPTDLPGWDVRAVAAHLAHVESGLAGNPQDQVEVPDLPHVTGLMGQFMEAGPVARRAWPPERVVAELEDSVAARLAAMRDDPPADVQAPGPGFAGLIGWSWLTLAGNRCVDMWMHEQDVRRAVGRPGNLDSPGAAHVQRTFARSLGYVVGKLAAAPPGSTVVIEVRDAPTAGPPYAVGVDDDGRGAPLPAPPDDPTVRLAMGFEDFVVLSGGRQPAAQRGVTVTGDPDLGGRLLAAMAVTP